MTYLDQTSASKNIWWIIRTDKGSLLLVYGWQIKVYCTVCCWKRRLREKNVSGKDVLISRYNILHLGFYDLLQKQSKKRWWNDVDYDDKLYFFTRLSNWNESSKRLRCRGLLNFFSREFLSIQHQNTDLCMWQIRCLFIFIQGSFLSTHSLQLDECFII